MTRWSSLSSAALALACASRGPAFESVSKLPDEPRYPAGVEVERPTTLPDAGTRGSTHAGVLVLETPMDPEQARAVVSRFFRAMVEESGSGLESVLSPQAMVQAGSRRESARSYYLGRFSRFDYRAVRGEALFHEGDVELWERADGGSLRITPPPLEPGPHEVVIRVRVTASWVGRPRLFADELIFRLAPKGAGFVIREVIEDFNPG
jgi:hypothetical protein